MASFDTRRIAALAFAFGALAAALVFAQPVTRILQREWIAWQNRPDPVVATDEEMAAILREVVTANSWSGRSRTKDGKPLAKMLLVNRTMDFCPAPEPKQAFLYCAASSTGAFIRSFPWGSPMTEKLRREMELASRTVRKVPDPHLPTVELMAEASADTSGEHDDDATNDATNDGDGWDEIYALYPDAGSLLLPSVPVLTRDRSQALIYIEQMCDGLCGAGDAYLLERTAQGWKQIAKVHLLDM